MTSFTCAICLSDSIENQSTLNCGHQFCKKCIGGYIDNKFLNSMEPYTGGTALKDEYTFENFKEEVHCPLCRQMITSTGIFKYDQLLLKMQMYDVKDIIYNYLDERQKTQNSIWPTKVGNTHIIAFEWGDLDDVTYNIIYGKPRISWPHLYVEPKNTSGKKIYKCKNKKDFRCLR